MQMSNLSVDQVIWGGGAFPKYEGFKSFLGWFLLFYCIICFMACKHHKYL